MRRRNRSAIHVVDRHIWLTEIDVIQNVLEARTELDVSQMLKFGVFHQAEIENRIARTNH